MLARRFFLFWVGFLIVAAVMMTAEWLIFTAFNTQAMPVRPAVFRAALGVAVFPLISWVLIQSERAFLKE